MHIYVHVYVYEFPCYSELRALYAGDAGIAVEVMTILVGVYSYVDKHMHMHTYPLVSPYLYIYICINK